MIWRCCGCAERQDIIRGRKMRATGACVGALIGLVAITPAAGYVNIGAAFLFGVIGSVVCCGVLEAMERWGSRYVDDTLDVFAVHGVGECGLGMTLGVRVQGSKPLA
jgi:Amt family ammonium transporter